MRLALSTGAIVVVIAGCSSGGGGSSTPTPTATPTATPTPLGVSGTVTDYFSATPLVGVALETTGLMPAVTTSSGAGGAWSIPVSAGSDFRIEATTANYRPTVSEPIAVAGSSRTITLTVLSIADTNRQYVGLSLSPTAGTAIAISDLRTATDGAAEGIPLSSISLVDPGGTAIAGAKGPYFFGIGGDMVDGATLSSSTAYGGHARVGFLDVPPGPAIVRVVDGPTEDAPFTAIAGGAHLVRNAP